jgi:hypothetical protein
VTTAVRTPPNHNTLTCYTKYNCRLPECVQRYHDWDARRRAAQAAGEWQPHVDAEPVREHLRALAASGITLHRAAEIAGIGPRSLHPLFQPENGRRRPVRHTVRPEIAARILAIDPEKARPAKVAPTGSVRRIQALVAIGWPMRHMAAHLDLSNTYVHALVQRSTSDHLVLASTADKVEDGYLQLRTRRPGRHGITPLMIKKARNMAASRDWPPPAYWDGRMDVIDDPHFTPEYGITRAEILAEEARWLIGGGLTRDQAAKQLGVSRFYIDRALREYPALDAEPVAA